MKSEDTLQWTMVVPREVRAKWGNILVTDTKQNGLKENSMLFV